MNSIVIELLNENDIDKINDLYLESYGKTRTKEQFQWEFLKGPGGKAIYIIAKDSETGKIVGTQCAMPLNLINASNEQILSAKSEDTLVHRDYRGQHIFEKMYERLFLECKLSGIEFIWGFTYAIKPFTKIGFTAPFKSSLGILTLKTQMAFSYLASLNPKNTFSEKSKIFILSCLSKLQSIKINLRTSQMGSYQIKETPEYDLDSVLLPNLQKFTSLVYLQQNTAFLNWRIYNNPYPGKHYSYSLYDSSDLLLGNTIYNCHNEVAYIIQMIFHPTVSQNIRQAFTKKTIAELQKKNIFLIRHWGFENNDFMREEMKFLKSMGFVFINKGITFVWKTLNDRKTLNPSEIIISRMASQGTN